MNDLLAYTTALPVVELEAGETLVAEGSTTGSMWVLESGELSVRKSGMEVNRVAMPGAAIGEVAALLGTHHGATLMATTPTRLRFAADATAFLEANPTAMRSIAAGLAERLHFVTTYLVDVKLQYGDAPGLAMVSDVIARLANFGPGDRPARPGSQRDPNPDY